MSSKAPDHQEIKDEVVPAAVVSQSDELNQSAKIELQKSKQTAEKLAEAPSNQNTSETSNIKEQISSAPPSSSVVSDPAIVSEASNDSDIVQTDEPVEIVPEVPVRDPNLVEITLRPVDKEWVMGEDWVVDLHCLMTLVDIKAFVEKHRGISKHRIQLRLKGKVFQPNREIWTLRRLGIYDGYVIQVEPTLSGSWLWNPLLYYQLKLLDDVCAVVEGTTSLTSTGRISMKELSQKVKPPPCITTSLRVFLRQYPERIYIHTDTTDHELWVHVSHRPFQLPTFGNFSVEIGSFPYFKVKRYDWAANKDIDDMYKIEALPAEEEAALQEDMARMVAEAIKSGKGTAENSAAQTINEVAEDGAEKEGGELQGDGSVAEESVLTDDQQAAAAALAD